MLSKRSAGPCDLRTAEGETAEIQSERLNPFVLRHVDHAPTCSESPSSHHTAYADFRGPAIENATSAGVRPWIVVPATAKIRLIRTI
jgi:hypothetical protein